MTVALKDSKRRSRKLLPPVFTAANAAEDESLHSDLKGGVFGATEHQEETAGWVA